MKSLINEVKKYKRNILNLVYALVTLLALLIYFKIIFSYESYYFAFLIVFLLLFIFYNKFNIKLNKRENIVSSILAVIISFILIIGSLVNSHVNEINGTIFTFHNLVYAVVGVFGFFVFFKRLFSLFLKHLPKITNEPKKMTKKQFLTVFIFILILWLPYFLRYFPAVMSNDSYYILHYVENLELNDHHALGHIWFVGLFYLIGKTLFHSMNMGVAFYTIIQMIICGAIFTYMIKFLYEKGVKKICLIFVTIFIALSPLFAIYSITLWKDVLFSMAFVTLFISLYKFIDENYKISLSTSLMYLFSILAILFFRNNGIYVLLLLFPFLVFFAEKSRRFVTISNIVIIILYFVIKGPVYNFLGVERGASVESFSMPLQQIARAIVNDGDISDTDYKYLEKLLDIDKVKENYNPTISDPVKNVTNNKTLTEDKGKFILTWFKIGINNPRIYIDSYLCSTLGYWYPDVIYWATAGESKSIFEEVDVYSDPILFDDVEFDVLTSRKIPLSSVLWSIGTMFIILIISTMLMIYKRKQKYLLAYIPLYCLWFTLMIASPVFAELRYIYGLFVCVPLLIFIPLLENKRRKNEKIKKI